MPSLAALTLVCSCTETGSQTIQHRDRWDYSGALRWAAQCRPQEVRQVYLGTRELTRRERFQPEIIDAVCEESALVRECKAIVAAAKARETPLVYAPIHQGGDWSHGTMVPEGCEVDWKIDRPLRGPR